MLPARFQDKTMADQRLLDEIEHGKLLAGQNAGEIWNWETPAGKIRWKRRAGMLTGALIDDMKVLEIGCGTGFFTKEISKLDVDLTAIDISLDLIAIARTNMTGSRVEFLIENAYQMTFEDKSSSFLVVLVKFVS